MVLHVDLQSMPVITCAMVITADFGKAKDVVGSRSALRGFCHSGAVRLFPNACIALYEIISSLLRVGTNVLNGINDEIADRLSGVSHVGNVFNGVPVHLSILGENYYIDIRETCFTLIYSDRVTNHLPRWLSWSRTTLVVFCRTVSYSASKYFPIEFGV